MAYRRARLTLAGVMVATSALVVTPAGTGVAAPLAAPPGCSTQPASAPMSTENLGAQQRYLPDQLMSLATGAGVTVAVLDSGVDGRHPQLRGRLLPGSDYLDPGVDGSRDCVGHGTAVASIIAAAPRNDTDFRGLAPAAKILPVRVTEQLSVDGRESGRRVTAADFAKSIRFAVDKGADVLNLSVVLYEDNSAVRAAIEYAVTKDVVVVAAVGNKHENGDPTPYPAAYDGVLGVGAIDRHGRRAQVSQIGSYVDVVAPGIEVGAAALGRGQQLVNGTSFATPFVSATAALIREYQQTLTASQIVDRIVASADPASGDGRGYGAGVLNPYRAVTETGAAARSLPAATPIDSRLDPVAAARGHRRSHAGREALWLAGGAGVLVVFVVLAAAVLPRGARRRWRPAEPA